MEKRDVITLEVLLHNGITWNRYVEPEPVQLPVPARVLESKVLESLVQQTNPEKITPQLKNTFNIDNIEVNFPFTPYDAQYEVMRAVLQCLRERKNGLIQSPTGTGKTLCLLAASLAYAQQINQKNGGKFKIIYCSRTHTQLKQVVRELAKTSYRPRTVVLGAREKYCINSDVREAAMAPRVGGGARLDLDRACACALEQKNGLSCTLKRDASDIERVLPPALRDIEDLVADAQEQAFCPYFYARDTRATAELLLVPYTYVLEQTQCKNLFLARGTEDEHGLLIFDEAHNIAKAAEDGYSYDISCRQLEGILARLYEVEPPEDEPESAAIMVQYLALCSAVTILLDNLRKCLSEMGVKNNEATTAEGDSQQIYLKPPEGASKTAILEPLLGSQWQNFVEELIPGALDFADKCAVQASQDDVRIGAIGHFLRGVQRVATQVLQLQKQGGEGGEILQYALCLSRANSSSVREGEAADLSGSFRLQCLDASLAFQALRKRYKIVLASGTLAPFGAWQEELGLPFEVQLEANDVLISREKQVLAGIVDRAAPLSTGASKVITGAHLNFTHVVRQNVKAYNKMIADTGALLADLFAVVPSGILVVFASHALLTECVTRWRSSSTWDALGHCKQLFVEDRNITSSSLQQGDTELQSLLLSYTKAATSVRGGALFAACRGRLIEGIDFSDELARAVVLIGVPNLPPCAYVDMKLDYLQRRASQHLQGSDWFEAITVRALNQAIGRVVRHREDYGIVALCDLRFTKYTEQLPKWLGEVIHYDLLQEYLQKVQAFFTLDRQNLRKQESSLPAKRLEVKELSDEQLYPELHGTQSERQESAESGQWTQTMHTYKDPKKNAFLLQNEQDFPSFDSSQKAGRNKAAPQKNQFPSIGGDFPTLGAKNPVSAASAFPSLTGSTTGPSSTQASSYTDNGSWDQKSQQQGGLNGQKQALPNKQQQQQQQQSQVLGHAKKKGKSIVYISGGFK